jgi:hypothetical protein
LIEEIDGLKKYTDFQDRVQRRVMIEFLARFLYLRGLFISVPQLSIAKNCLTYEQKLMTWPSKLG